jgi:hypothetical protein
VFVVSTTPAATATIVFTIMVIAHSPFEQRWDLRMNLVVAVQFDQVKREQDDVAVAASAARRTAKDPSLGKAVRPA